MPLLVWNEKLETGIQLMDNQHKYWLFLMNKLHDAVQENIDKTLIEKIFSGMLDYTRIHFADEERLLFENGYPDYDAHKKLHDNFIEQLEELRKRLQQGQLSDWQSTLEIINLMSKWFREHIRKADQKYAAFLKEKGVN